MTVVAKARAAQLTSFRSITAAAEGLITFRFCSSRQKARLLACLGSSVAQWNGGYESGCVFVEADVLIGPLSGGPVCRPYGESGSGPFFFVGAGHWPARRRASAIPEPTLIRLAFGQPPSPQGEGLRAADSRPYSSQKFFWDWVGEALGPPAVNGPGTVCLANPGAVVEPHQL